VKEVKLNSLVKTQEDENTTKLIELRTQEIMSKNVGHMKNT
jgi:hypothetical protein